MIIQGDAQHIPLADNSVDLTITSPPYDNIRTYLGNLVWNESIWKAIIKELFRVTKPGGVVVWVVADATINGSETGTSFRQALWAMECGFNLYDTMIYLKNGPAYPSKNKYYSIFEYMFVLSKGQPATTNLLKDRKNMWAGQKWSKTRSRRNKKGELSTSVWDKDQGGQYGVRFNAWKYNVGHGYSTKDELTYQHPAIFPEQLAHDHIVSWSNPGDIVLDAMAGSGTTGVAAIKTGRQYILIEKEPAYIEIIKRRIKKALSQPRLFQTVAPERERHTQCKMI